MRAKIFSMVKPDGNTVVASARIARFLRDELRLPLTCDASVASEKLDVLLLVNGAFAFCKDLPALGAAIADARRLIWVQNDYTIIPPDPDSKAQSPFRAAFRIRRERGLPDSEFWTTCSDRVLTERDRYVNWNCLAVDEERLMDDDAWGACREHATADLFYYGSFRHTGGRMTRTVFYDRYFRDCPVPVTISSPSKKFAERYGGALLLPKIPADEFMDTLARRGLGLYVGDVASATAYHSPACRFYEMLSAGLPMIFQPEADQTMQKAGYHVPVHWQVKDAAGVAWAMERRGETGAYQRQAWKTLALRERRELPELVRAAWLEVSR